MDVWAWSQTLLTMDPIIWDVDLHRGVMQLSGVIMAGRVCRSAKAEVMFLAHSADATAEACRCELPLSQLLHTLLQY